MIWNRAQSALGQTKGATFGAVWGPVVFSPVFFDDVSDKPYDGTITYFAEFTTGYQRRQLSLGLFDIPSTLI